MKNSRIAIRPLPLPECVVSLAPTVAALKRQNPGAQVGIVAEESLREASLLVPDLDFFAPEAAADHTIDLVGPDVFEGASENPSWKANLLAAPGMSNGNPYHIVDLLKKASQVDTVDANFELTLPDLRDPLPEALGRGGVRVAVCTGSLSQAQVEATLEALSRINASAEVFLLGTIKDKKVSSQVTSAWDGKLNVHDLCGQQSLVEHAAVLRACDLSVTGPGISAILSAGYGTFTVCVDDTPAGGPLFYPYGHGHLVIQRSVKDPVATNLAPFLQGLVNYALSANAGNVPTLDQWREFADTMIAHYLGKIRLVATQRVEIILKDGSSFTELFLRPLLFTGSELYDVMQTFYRLLWEHSLHQRTITTYDLEILHQDTMPLLCDLLKPLEQLYELGNFGRTYSGYVRESLSSDNLGRAQHESARLEEVENLIQALAGTQPFFAPLYGQFRQEQRMLNGETPLALADEMASLFGALQERVLVLLDLAKTLFHTVFENESALNAGPTQQGTIEKADSHG